MQIEATLKTRNDIIVDKLTASDLKVLLQEMQRLWPKSKLQVGDKIAFKATSPLGAVAMRTFTVDTLP